MTSNASNYCGFFVNTTVAFSLLCAIVSSFCLGGFSTARCHTSPTLSNQPEAQDTGPDHGPRAWLQYRAPFLDPGHIGTSQMSPSPPPPSPSLSFSLPRLAAATPPRTFKTSLRFYNCCFQMHFQAALVQDAGLKGNIHVICRS